MLQQTRVETVVPYYERFLSRYPSIRTLAEASEAELLEAWAGLGYYRRARQLQAAARLLAAEHKASFPRDYEAVRALPGIGDYTAAAVCSIAFDLPYGVLDGNVVRVASRLEDDHRDVTRTATRKHLQRLVDGWISEVGPGDRGDFNQALMELGAVVCTPTSPKCLLCPLRARCLAFRRGTSESLPVKPAKAKLLRVDLAVALVERGNSLLMRKRPEDESIMPGFWELPQFEGSESPPGFELQERLGTFRHGITVRAFQGTVYRAKVRAGKPPEWRWVSESRRGVLPLTTITRKALAAAQL